MLLGMQIVIIVVLVMALVLIMKEENKARQARVSQGTVKEYWDGQERRKTLRINTSIIVRYSVEKKQEARLNGRMKDVSQGGMRLLVNEKLSQGTLLLIEFHLPETKDIIESEGKVVWTSGDFEDRDQAGRRVFHTGVQFVNINPEDRNRLFDYIKKFSKAEE